jgi:hypothetical protein
MNFCTASVAIMQGVATLFTTIVFEDSSTVLQGGDPAQPAYLRGQS